MDGVENDVLLSILAQQLRPKNAVISDIYFNLLDSAGISSTLVLNEIAETKRKGNCIPFKRRTAEAAKFVHSLGCSFWVCAHFSEN